MSEPHHPDPNSAPPGLERRVASFVNTAKALAARFAAWLERSFLYYAAKVAPDRYQDRFETYSESKDSADHIAAKRWETFKKGNTDGRYLPDIDD